MLSNAKITAVVPVTDLARSRSFYEGILGLTPKHVLPQQMVTEYENAGTTLLIYQRETASSGEHTIAGFTLEQSDFDDAVVSLLNHGVKFDVFNPPGVQLNWDARGVLQEENGAAAWFKDPDGNVLSIMTGTMG